MNFWDSRQRRSPFIDVRFISPGMRGRQQQLDASENITG